jgi:hypothetical protein
MRVLPSRCQRERHEDTLNARRRSSQTELCPSIIHQIEFNISSPPQLLPPLHFLSKWHILASLDNGYILVNKCVTAVLYKGKTFLSVPILEIIKEDATNATSFVAVRDIKVVVAPFFEARVKRGIMLVTDLLDCLVEMNTVFWVEIRGSLINRRK